MQHKCITDVSVVHTHDALLSLPTVAYYMGQTPWNATGRCGRDLAFSESGDMCCTVAHKRSKSILFNLRTS
jgi:hypothetical protein